MLEAELNSLHAFINKVPHVAEEITPADLRRLLSRNFFPALAVKQMYRWAQLR